MSTTSILHMPVRTYATRTIQHILQYESLRPARALRFEEKCGVGSDSCCWGRIAAPDVAVSEGEADGRAGVVAVVVSGLSVHVVTLRDRLTRGSSSAPAGSAQGSSTCHM